MSGAVDHIYAAALPVAVGLLILAAFARAALWTPLADDDLRRIARQYLEPLTTWCLIAVITYGIGLGLAAKATLPSLGLMLGIAAFAALLRPAGPAGSLWTPPVSEDASRRQGLWSR
ncbi:MAG: hypothetical protein QOE28_3004 [Solirubrobacteraceae bacterium]|jgi:hypothetical protein|nr:hypothetical protein [Solirubrobacteraceae bacterium]